MVGRTSLHVRDRRVGAVRIVSLLPSTTEILFAIGAGDDVVGRDLRVRLPGRGADPQIVSTSAMPEGLTPRGDRRVRRRRDGAAARTSTTSTQGALAGLDADLVVTQDLCAVCAVDVSVVDDALAHLGCTAEVLTIDPHTLDEVLESILTLGRATGHEAAAEAARRLAQRRAARRRRDAGRGPAAAARDAAGVDRPAVRARPLDPRDDRGRRRRARCSARPGEVASGSPGRPCAPPSPTCRRRARAATTAPGRRRSPTSWSARRCCRPASPCTPSTPTPSWARPGTRLVDGVEELAAILHPAPGQRSETTETVLKPAR